MVIYHSSSKQGLKELDPNNNTSKHISTKDKFIYGTNDKDYAAAFAAPWDDKIAKFGRHGKGQWTLELWDKHKDLLKNPASMYTLESKGFKQLKDMPVEFTSKHKAKVISEKKYKSAMAMIRDHDIKLILTKEEPCLVIYNLEPSKGY